MAQPRLVAALEDGRVGVGHAMALLDEVSHLDPPHAAAVLAAVLDGEEPEEATPGELRTAAERAAITIDPEVARRRHEAAKRTAGFRGRPLPDGMAQVVVECTAVEMATALAAVDGRAAAMAFDDQELSQGQREVAALLHALGCDRTGVQAVLECPVEKAVDLHAPAGAGVWSVDVRMPLAVALGLSDHPAVLSGYGPIGADEARALLPSAELVKACVDAHTGEVLTVDPPVRTRTWAAADPDRDHRRPYPLGPTSPEDLQNVARRWHRATHDGWTSQLLPDGSTRWTSPTGGRCTRHPKRTRPPAIPPGSTLPPLDD